jgi:hypothetical protein
LERNESLHAEPDGVDEVDDVRGEGAVGAQEGRGYEALEIKYKAVGLLSMPLKWKGTKNVESKRRKGWKGTQHSLNLHS